MAAHQLRLGALRQWAALAVVAAACTVHAAETPLRGTSWASGAAASPRLLLDAVQPRLSGYAGCNRISAGFKLDGDRLAFSGMVSTRRACVPDDDADERLLKALAEVRRWRIESGALLLSSESGAPLLTLHAAPERP